MGRTFTIGKIRLSVSQRLYLGNSSVCKVLRRDLIQSLRKNFDNSVTLYLSYASCLSCWINVNWAVSGEQVSLSTCSCNLS